MNRANDHRDRRSGGAGHGGARTPLEPPAGA